MSCTRLILLLVVTSSRVVTAAKKQNILFILADDLGYNDVDFHTPNRSVVLTPNLRRLAQGGVRFTNHHVQPFCSPTRAALMTGRHVLRYGLQNTVIWPQDAWAIPMNETFLSQILHDAGYYTAYFGKWHLGFYKKKYLPMNRGYDEQYGYYLGGEDYWTHMRNDGLDWHRNDTVDRTANGTYSADLLGDAAIEYVTRRAGFTQPWFLYLPWQSVHSPLEAPQKYLDMYPNLTGNVKIRAAMVTALDDNVGRLITALEKTKQLDNTIIVFSPDNGAPYGKALDEDFRPTSGKRPPNATHGSGGGSNLPLTGWKHWVFEGGVRSAAFIYSSLLKNPGTQHNGLFHIVDWLPTLAKLGGGNTSRTLPLDGFDIWNAIQEGGNSSPRTEIPINIAACGTNFTGQTIVDGPQAAILIDEMKLIVDCWWKDTKLRNTTQLYNLTEDIGEWTDLSSKHPKLVDKMLKRLDYWEGLSVDPYPKDQDGCGKVKPQGSSGQEYWDAIC